MTDLILRKSAKLILALIVASIFYLLSYYLQPVIGSQVAINQLNDTYTSSAGVKFWNDFKGYAFIIYPIIVLLFFSKEIYYIFIKNMSKHNLKCGKRRSSK